MYYFLILTQYKSMKWLLIGFIFMFILLVVTYPFKISWYFHINLLNNIGFVVFKVLFIRLMCERFKIDNHFEFQTEREKKKKKNQVFFHNYIFCLSNTILKICLNICNLLKCRHLFFYYFSISYFYFP